MCGAVFGAMRPGLTCQSFRESLHVFAFAATDQAAEFFAGERQAWIVIYRTPLLRSEEPSNQASQPPHAKSLASATNPSERVLFRLPRPDCKSPEYSPH